VVERREGAHVGRAIRRRRKCSGDPWHAQQAVEVPAHAAFGLGAGVWLSSDACFLQSANGSCMMHAALCSNLVELGGYFGKVARPLEHNRIWGRRYRRLLLEVDE
jgi:hypothetical protein